jgi:hypothetical protein
MARTKATPATVDADWTPVTPAEALELTEYIAIPVGEIPPGYETRAITLPAKYWPVLDRFAEKANLTVSEWLERYLRFMAR